MAHAAFSAGVELPEDVGLPKVSPAFEEIHGDVATDARHDAIVLFRSKAEGLRLPKRIDRRDFLQARFEAVASVRDDVLGRYEERFADHNGSDRPLRTEELGGLAMPAARVEVTAQSLEALAEQADVLAILPDQPVRLIQPRRVQVRPLLHHEADRDATWALEMLEVPSLWSRTRGGDVVVGVLDTGVYGDHPALTGRLEQFVVIDSLRRRIDAKPAFDAGFHGTHVCGTIAGRCGDDGVAMGVAPDAQLAVSAVLMDGGAKLSTVIEGIAWAVEQGADIINMSLGFGYYEP
jgi:subtilisin family serine protease